MKIFSPKQPALKIPHPSEIGDFGFEIATSFRFFIDYARGKPNTRVARDHANFAEAFGLNDEKDVVNVGGGAAGEGNTKFSTQCLRR